MSYKQPDGLTRIYQNGLLVLGIVLMAFAVNELWTIWTPKSSLISLDGTLSSSDISTTTVKDRKGHKSQKVELHFSLTGQDKRFLLFENVGQDYNSKKLSEIHSALKRSNNIKVWIRKNDNDDHQPKVFQIDNDRGTILEFESVKSENKILAAFMLVMGIGSIVLFTWFRYPEKLKKAFE